MVDRQADEERIEVLLTFLVRLPRLNHRVHDGFASRSEHTTLDIHVLPLSFRRDRLPERDCMCCRRRRETRIDRFARYICRVEDEPSGASSVKNGPRTLLSVAIPFEGLLSASTRADTPSTSERRMNSWRSGVHVWPVRVRNLIVLIHSSVVRLWAIGCIVKDTDFISDQGQGHRNRLARRTLSRGQTHEAFL
jgi:hypothetical protein